MNTKLLIMALLISTFCSAQELFVENFETGLAQWEYQEYGISKIIETQDSVHNSVLQLTPNKTAECVLIKGSDRWKRVAIMGEALFPTDKPAYLGLVYNYNKTDRIDFGSIYIQGKNDYVRVNPHYDGNASRALYEEYRTPLVGDAEIRTNEWFSFKAEIIDSVCHFYVSDMSKPKVIFNEFEYSMGEIGFKARLVGGGVWLDNISVKQIVDFSYSPSKDFNESEYNKTTMIDNWKALGPFENRIVEVEQANKNNSICINGKTFRWDDFSVDSRGCLLAGKLCRFATDEKLAYFSTHVDLDTAMQSEIQFSSLNKLHVWLNTEYVGSIEKQKFAWFDFVSNPEHIGASLPISLKKGSNRILVLVEGGNYSGDGFYSHIKIKDRRSPSH